MTAYYNEIEPYAAEWLRNLIKAGHIAPGVVDERSIEDVCPSDLSGFPNAISSPGSESGLTLCGKPDGPTSAPSGRARARASLSARQAKEQGLMMSGTYGPPSSGLSTSVGLQWCLENRLRARLLTHGSTLYTLTWKPWVTPSGVRRSRLRASVLRTSATAITGWPTPTTQANTHCYGPNRTIQLKTYGAARLERHLAGGYEGESSGMGNADNAGLEGRRLSAERARELFVGQTGVAGRWRDADWIYCRDGKYRPVEPGTFPLVASAAGRMGRVCADQERLTAQVPRKDQGNRVGRLRGYGNAINAEAARVFIESAAEAIEVYDLI